MIAVESYRQAIRNNKLLKTIVIALSIVIITLVVAIILMFPLKKTEYVLYEFSSSGQTFYRIEDASKVTNRSLKLLRMIARNYINKRETIDRLTELERFKTIKELSSAKVFDDFELSYTKVNKAIGDKGKRRIVIELDNPFNNNWNSRVHIVDFATIDEIDNKKIKQYWKAVISYRFNEQKIRVDDLVQNPLGVEVIDYSITKRNSFNKLEDVYE